MELDAGGRRRFCEACDKHVHDLSAMDERSAAAFWEATARLEVCISYLSDESGEILFAQGANSNSNSNFVSLDRLRTRADGQRRRQPSPVQTAAAASLTALLAACTPHGDELELQQIDAEAIEVEEQMPHAPVVIPELVPPTAEDGAPCETSEPEAKAQGERRTQRKKGKRVIKRTAGVRHTADPFG